MQPAVVTGYRLSFQQALLWREQQRGLACSHSLCRIRIKGKLNVECFQQALQELIARHTILRTRFCAVPGLDMPMQVVAERETIACPRVSLESIQPSQQAHQLDTYTRTLRETAFDLETAPLLRCVLFYLSPSNYLFFFCLPALCADAASLPILFSELVQCYRAFLGEGEFSTDDPLQYIDVSTWQNDLLHEDDAKEHYEFWKKIDVSSLDNIIIPFRRDFYHPSSPDERDSFSASIMKVTEAIPLSARFQSLLQSTNTSLEAFLLATWLITLWRFTGQAPTIVGIEGNGRYHEELVTAPGPYSRVVPVSLSLSEHLSFERILSLVRSFLSEAKMRQMYFSRSIYTIPQAWHFPFQFAWNLLCSNYKLCM